MTVFFWLVILLVFFIAVKNPISGSHSQNGVLFSQEMVLAIHKSTAIEYGNIFISPLFSGCLFFL